jgi:alpha-beta hydrolase superfamily lysophospholipase
MINLKSYLYPAQGFRKGIV